MYSEMLNDKQPRPAQSDQIPEDTFVSRQLDWPEMKAAWDTVLSQLEKQRFERHLQFHAARALGLRALEHARREYQLVGAQQAILERKYQEWLQANPEPTTKPAPQYEVEDALAELPSSVDGVKGAVIPALK